MQNRLGWLILYGPDVLIEDHVAMTSIVGQLDEQRRAKAEKAVDKLIEDMCDRSGFQNVWDELSETDRAELREVWITLVLRWGP